VHGSWSYCAQNTCHRISSQGLFENSGQFRISIRQINWFSTFSLQRVVRVWMNEELCHEYLRLGCISKFVNDSAKRKKRFIDVRTLFESFSCGIRAFLSLRTYQDIQIKKINQRGMVDQQDQQDSKNSSL
jgi:hypothetical protein